jgi:serine/threonine protein kinase
MGDSESQAGAMGPLSSRLNWPVKPGEILDGKYTVTRLIGAGSMGFVFSAARPSLGDEVAIKVLRSELLSDAQLVARFAREARVAARIKSEHVACVFDVGHLVDGAPFIVMERLDGKDLRWVLAERGKLPAELSVDYVLQVCEALAIAHANGITHRDIKPENLFASRQAQGEDVIKVLDFGISKMNLRAASDDDKLPLVKTTMAMGSPMYMSPEQIRAAKDIDGRSDIWALGCVLYELLTGNPAFSAPSVTELCALILESKPPDFASLGLPSVPALEAVIWRCIEKDPARRFQSIGELAVALCPFAPTRSLISIERCCIEHDVPIVIEVDRDEAATVPSFVAPHPPFNWARAAFGFGMACVCCALLFSPHADRPNAMATLQTETELETTADRPPGNAPEAVLRNNQDANARSSHAATTTAPPTTASPAKPVSSKSRPRQARSDRWKDELDVGF